MTIIKEQGAEGIQTSEPKKAHKNSNLGNYFRIQYLAFGCYIVGLNFILALVVPRLFCEHAFICVRFPRMLFISSRFKGVHHISKNLY